jgi:hypothetical protein
MESQGELIWPTGGIVVGSAECSADRQMKVTGGAVIDVRHIDVCSGPEGCGQNCGDGSVEPWPVREHYLADPFAGVPEPEQPAAVNCIAAGGTKLNAQAPCVFSGGFVPAGLYPTGLELQGTITLEEDGLYYVKRRNQRALSIAPDAEVTGTRVIFFNGMDGNSCGSIHIDANAEVLITPPASGDYKDLTIFQARDCDQEMRTEAGVIYGLEDGPWGAIYVPAGAVNIGCFSCGPGDKANDINTRVVAYEIKLNGPMTFADIKIPSGTPWNGDVHLSE